ncbi:hypothetical protein CVO76_03635 [Arthrobacter agilis]|uniref:Mucin-associated surface protein n=2 Tax=Arthrobacter agilis TaxID=37921 RepID=A0A2L0UC23_9MICC|nr:hypothetical protein CVO76_03635 [Arthrobacter agilis]
MGLETRFAVLAAGVLLLAGCGSEAIDAGTAGDFQAEVRTIASTAAAGDPAGAIVLAQRLKGEVDDARAAGAVTEDRATLIGMRIDALVASLGAGQVPADATPPVPAPSDDASDGEAPEDGATGEDPAEQAPADPAPAEEPADPAPATAPAETTEPPAPVPAPVEEGDGESGDTGSEDTGADPAPGNSGGNAADPAEQQRKAEEKAREAAEKAAERARDKGKGENGGN